jgi:hypothetical protein
MDRRLLLVSLAFSLTCGGSGSKSQPEGGVSTGGSGGVTDGGSGGTGGRGGSGGGGGTPTMGGRGGTGGAGGAGGTGGGMGGMPGASTGSVLERNKNASRDGHFVQPMLTKANAARMALDMGFNATFAGTMWASPLYFENGPGGKGIFIAVTTANNVFALDETTGAQVWMKNVGMPAGANGPNARCGNIHPLGILATPVIDAQARTLFLSAAVGDTTAILRQEVHALNIDTGEERPGWPVDVAAKLGFDPQPHNPRSALSLVNGIVYIAYGGHIGDCGNYHGRIVAIDSRDPTKVAGWATGGVGEAIWAPGGMASDGNGVIAATGNRTGGGGGHQDSEEVVRVTGMATFTAGPNNVFVPAIWQQMDNDDADFASNNPIIVEVAGATPSKMVVAAAKDGHVYFLDAARLGGMGGQLADFVLARGSNVFTAPTGYRTTRGTHVAFTVQNMPTCPAGSMAAGRVVASVLVNPGPPLRPEVTWCTAIASSTSPITTTTDGTNEAIVWFIDGARLKGVDGDTGAVVFSGMDACQSGVQKWTSPIAVRGRIVTGANGRLCSWSPH